jgi:glycosyltransferase involved in cell wall biosynthesis
VASYRTGVSVVIPTFNRATIVPRAIDSALAAIAPGDEIIVADDGSTDDTKAVVEAYGDPVRFVPLPHGGPGAARNGGVAAATKPLVAFLDSDDEWFPDKLELQRRFLEARPDVLFVFTDFGVRLEDGTERRRFLPFWLIPPRPLTDVFDPWVPYSSIAELPAGRADFPVHIGSIYREQMHHNLVAAFTFIGRREELAGRLHFADDIPICEDWHAFGNIADLGPAAIFDTETAWQNGHSGPRVSNHPQHELGSGWLLTLDRIWGQDETFLTANRAEFEEAKSRAHLIRARSLVRHRRLREGGRELRAAGGLRAAARAARRDVRARRRMQASRVEA